MTISTAASSGVSVGGKMSPYEDEVMRTPITKTPTKLKKKTTKKIEIKSP